MPKFDALYPHFVLIYFFLFPFPFPFSSLHPSSPPPWFSFILNSQKPKKHYPYFYAISISFFWKFPKPREVPIPSLLHLNFFLFEISPNLRSPLPFFWNLFLSLCNIQRLKEASWILALHFPGAVCLFVEIHFLIEFPMGISIFSGDQNF